MFKVAGLPYWRLSGFYFLFFLTTGGLVPYWSLYLQSINLSAEDIGILSAVIVVIRIFSSLIWGWVVDHTGKRMQVIRYTSLLSLLSFSFVLFSKDFWSLFVTLFVFSFFWSATLPQLEAVTLSHLGDASDNYTVVRIWGSIGFIVCVFVLGKYFDHRPIEHLLPILVITMLMVWLYSLFVPDMPVSYKNYNSQSFMKALMKPSVISLLTVCFLMQAGHGPYYTFFSIYLGEHHYSSSFTGTAWAFGVFAEVIVYVFIHRVIRRCNLRRLMILTLAWTTLRWLLIAWFVENIFILLFAQCLQAVSFGLYHAVAIQYIHGEFKGIHQGRGQALYSGVSFGAGLTFGNLVSGYLWNSIGSSNTYVFAALLSSIGLVIAFYGLQKK